MFCHWRPRTVSCSSADGALTWSEGRPEVCHVSASVVVGILHVGPDSCPAPLLQGATGAGCDRANVGRRRPAAGVRRTPSRPSCSSCRASSWRAIPSTWSTLSRLARAGRGPGTTRERQRGFAAATHPVDTAATQRETVTPNSHGRS